MSEVDELVRLSEEIARAIERRDTQSLRAVLAAGFLHRTPGGPSIGAEQFLTGIDGIPGEILSVRLEDIAVNVSADGALVTGIQKAQVRVDGQVHDDRRAFVDWFVRQDRRWLLRAAVDLPATSGT
jgi:ketosteroid isomerase-like protein